MENLFGSLHNEKHGYSGRKLAGLTGMSVAVIITYLKVPNSDMLHALYAWLLFILICLGLVTFQQIINFKNGNAGSKTDTGKD